jgi:hypothetical protein
VVTVTGRQILGAVIAVLAVGGWILAYLVALLVTRPTRPQPLPPTPNLGPEPPAVAALLAGGWGLSENAAEATLIDLAARRYLEFRQPANDPAQTTVHIVEAKPPGLNRYEQMVFDRVCAVAVGGVVPLTALAFRDPAQANGFGKRVRAAVIADSRARGLSRRRFGPVSLAVLTVMSVAAATGVALAVLLLTLKVPVAAFIWLFAALLFAGLANRSIGERDTPAGLAASAHWLAVRTWLRNTESFTDLPPAAVAVWDRYLAYGAALDATGVTSAVIHLGAGNRRVLWSSHTGSWRRVRVRYPRFWLRYGKPVGPLVIRGVVFTVLGGLLLFAHTRHFSLTAYESWRGRSSEVEAGPTLRILALLVGVPLTGLGLYLLARTILDAAAPTTVTGQVLWQQVWRASSQGKNRPSRPWLHYLAVDDGAGDKTTAWGLPSEWADRCTVGDTVRISAYRWTRRIRGIDVVVRAQEPTEPAATPSNVDIEVLVATELGRSVRRDAAGNALPSAELLLTAQEVSRAVGVAVTMQGVSNSGSARVNDGTVRFVTADGRTALTLAMGSGMGGRISMWIHRNTTAVAGIGDEAYGGSNWAVARKDGVVVSVSARTAHWWIDARSLHWLLSLAVSRLSIQANHKRRPVISRPERKD